MLAGRTHSVFQQATDETPDPPEENPAMRSNLQISAERAAVDLLQEKNPPNPEPSEQVMIDHFRCPREFVGVSVQGNLSESPGFFKFGPESVCFGRTSAFTPSPEAGRILNDALKYVRG